MRDRHTTLLQRLRWNLLSIPIFVKTLGIGAIVATIFGGIIFVRNRQNLTTSLYEVLEERAGAEAKMLANHLERPMTLYDLVRVQEVVAEAKKANPDILYIIVRDDQQQIIHHSFDTSMPTDLLLFPGHVEHPDAPAVRILGLHGKGLVFEASQSLVKGYAGHIQLGMSDRMVRQQVATLTSSIISGLVISIAIGVGLAAFLSFLITQPIQHLKRVAGEIKSGDFEVRSLIYSDDEIGELAMAFNEMADSLNHYRREVEEREETRLALIERVVSSHENERKLISRELHDHFGQSLLAVLVDIRTSRKTNHGSDILQKLEASMEKVVNDLGRIVRGMRPTILDDYGLNMALESYAKEASERYNIEVIYKYNCPESFDRLPGHIEVSLFRITQEAITNVVKHAEASQVSLILMISKTSTMLLIEDDGKGFNPSTVHGKGGLGLVGMHERAGLLGGRLDLGASIGEGTTVRITIPNGGKNEEDQTSHRG